MFSKDLLRRRIQEKRLALKRRCDEITLRGPTSILSEVKDITKCPNSVKDISKCPNSVKDITKCTDSVHTSPHTSMMARFRADQLADMIGNNKYHRVDWSCQPLDIKGATDLVVNDSPLLNDLETSQRQVIYNKIVQCQYAPVYLSHAHCHLCKTGLQRNLSRSVRVCPTCQMTTQTMKDSIIPIPQLRSKRTIVYNRCSLYRKYIMQFHANAPAIPRHLLDILHQKLFNVHILTSAKCRPTPIANILRQTQNTQWVSHAVRISRLMNKCRPILFTQSIIDRLVQRCEIINEYNATQLPEDCKSKFLNFDFITKQFLLMDEHKSLAVLFTAHKTKKVLERAENRLRCLCDTLNATNTFQMPWFVTYTSY